MKIAIKAGISVLLLACIWFLYKEFDGVRFKTESYENKIEQYKRKLISDSSEVVSAEVDYKIA